LIEADLLFVIAEISVALAGFSAIIGVLGSRSGASDVRVDALRLQVMLESCLVVAAASIVPVLLSYFEVNASAAWRLASAAFLLVQVPMEVIAFMRTSSMPDMKLSKFNVNTINWCLSIGADLVMLGILLDLVGTQASAYYMLAVFSLLVMSGLLFIQFAASTFIPRDE
jgi:hypothetical protein